MAEGRKGGLVVADTPQISVELVDNVMIEITVSAIGHDFTSVETTTVEIPVQCGRAVAKAIMDLLKK